MDLKSKALVVIEYISVHNDSPEMADIYMAAHVANGHCQNPHESWLEWLNAYYDGLVASGNFRPESQLTTRAADLGQAVREPEGRVCPHCGYIVVVSSRGRFHNHGSRANPCPGSGMYIEPANSPAPSR